MSIGKTTGNFRPFGDQESHASRYASLYLLGR